MALAIVGAIGIAASVAGSMSASSAAKSAANKQAQASADANATQLQMYNQTRTDLQPYNMLGSNAIGSINALNSGDYSGFMNSPDYKFTEQQGIGRMDASAASRGNLYSGGYSKDLVNFNQGLASQQFGNYYNRLAGLVSVGENAAAKTGNAAQNYANAYGQNVTNAGNAQAGGIINSANAYSNGLNQAAQAAGQFASSYGNRSSGASYNPTQGSIWTQGGAYSGYGGGQYPGLGSAGTGVG